MKAAKSVIEMCIQKHFLLILFFYRKLYKIKGTHMIAGYEEAWGLLG